MKQKIGMSGILERDWIGLIIIVSLFIFVTATESCRHDPFMDPNLMPIDTIENPIDTMMPIDTMGIPCDTDVVYFRNDILPIINSNCALSGCHDVATASDGVVLTDFEKIIETGDIEPFDLGDSKLYRVITETDPDKRMPLAPRDPLSADKIQLIAKWILQGAQNLECDAGVICDTTSVSYASAVVPILQKNCTGCHGGASPSGNVKLDTYAGVSDVANSGRLKGVITHTPGFPQMPQNQAKLPECEINTIVAWINQGATNN